MSQSQQMQSKLVPNIPKIVSVSRSPDSTIMEHVREEVLTTEVLH